MSQKVELELSDDHGMETEFQQKLSDEKRKPIKSVFIERMSPSASIKNRKGAETRSASEYQEEDLSYGTELDENGLRLPELN